jgi:ribose transport system substrate-binding protein
MHRISVRLLAALAAAVLLAVFTACGSDDGGGGSGGDTAGSGGSGETPEIKIGWSPPDITGVYKTATDYFDKTAEEANQNGFDVEVITRTTSSHNDYASQLAVIEDFISQGVDVIAISPSDVDAVKPGIAQANQAGIPVILVNLLEKQDDVEVASYVGFDNADAAKISAYAILDYYGGPGVLGSGEKVDVKPDTYLDLPWWEKVYAEADPAEIEASGAIIEGIAGTLFSRERLTGFDEVMSQYPGISILGEPIAADWNREKGIKAAENFLSRYSPAEMNFIWAASNEMGLGAINAAERKSVLETGGGEQPPQEGKVAIFTNDVTPESADAIRAGKLIAETHHGFPEWGWFGGQFAIQLACGQDVPAQYDIRPRTVYQGNVDQFYPTPQLPEIDWAKIKQGCQG